ncbi:hypothetical protein [Beijerinckia sp. L45]|uniref:hypothetical protein n=1 Tax=Beijerinckia sp. L45 TaxID=1641855 RepID=UPI00131E1B89|nr:hypothetical protein [Beijerinckia sp. L45]
MKLAIYFLLFLALMSPMAALAAPRGMGGIFQRTGPEAETLMVQPDGHGFHIDMSVSSPECAGRIVGQGTVTDKQEVTLQSVPEYAGQTICSIRLNYVKGNKAVDLTETSCGYFHGIACDFNGHLTRSDRR